MIGIFWILLYSLQIGLCLILVMARKDETKVGLFRYPLCGGGLSDLLAAGTFADELFPRLLWSTVSDCDSLLPIGFKQPGPWHG